MDQETKTRGIRGGALAAFLTLAAAGGVGAQPVEEAFVFELEPWVDGAGLRLCSELDALPDAEIIPWVRGYWTGANLYLGGTDLCSERANISGLSDTDVRALLGVHCRAMQDTAIMFAAWNALKGLPAMEGSRAAACGLQE